MLSCVQSDQWKQEVAKVIPKDITLEAVLRVARSVASEQKFLQCDPRSFLGALLKCARAGLYPDGREAHLIPFGKEVQAIFDWKGIVALASRAGILVTPKLVHENDEFSVEEDDGTGKTKVHHVVDYRKARGDIQAVYSRAVRPDGQVDYEIMTADEVEHVRQHYSRAKDSTPWKNSFGEMMKKTCIKRHSKRWDMSPEIRQALNADDDSSPSLKEPKLATPIFKEKEPPKEATVTSEPATVPPEVASGMNSLKAVRMLCKDAKIEEEDLVRYIVDLGLADESCTTLENIDADHETVLPMIGEQWFDFAERIKAVKEAQR